MPRMQFMKRLFLGPFPGHAHVLSTDYVRENTGVELRACPFCLCPEHVMDREERRIICANCGAEGPGAKQRGDLHVAAIGWNGEAFEEAPELIMRV